MPFDKHELKPEREKRCLAFCNVLRETDLVSSDLSSLLDKNAPPASQSSIAAVRAICTSIKAIPLPSECTKLICDFAFDGLSLAKDLFKRYLTEQRRRYSRLPGNIVFQHEANVGERVRVRLHCWQLSQRNLNRGTIISKDCDHGTEIAVRWDDGTVSGNTDVGLKCGKKGIYSLVYD